MRVKLYPAVEDRLISSISWRFLNKVSTAGEPTQENNMSGGDELTKALAELAKAGMAFSTETGPKGENVYIIDSVRLNEDELILLYTKRALTRDGIRRYLVDRVA
jgi:hypothetical protein